MVTATIRSTSPRCKQWMDTFGSETIAITSPIAVLGTVGSRAPKPYYRVAIDTLDERQFANVVKFIAERFKQDPDDVACDLRDPRHGLPILAEDVIVAVDARLFL